MGHIKTTFLMIIIIFLFTFAGYALGGESGMLIALFFSIITNFSAYWYSDKFILKMYNAKKVDCNSAPEIYEIVSDLALTAKLPMPSVYIISEDSPNAFATGRDHNNAAVAVTTGLTKILTSSELKGVLAHEIAHIYNRDMMISTFAATIAGAISSLTTFAMFFGGRNIGGRSINPIVMILIIFLAPLAATLIQMAISRSREFEADKMGSIFSKNPNGLASALSKIENFSKTRVFEAAEKNPSTAQMMIMNPLSGNGITNLFSTHPSTAERIKKLKDLDKSLHK